jgi:hypothetical protein
VASCDDCGPCNFQTVLDTALDRGAYWVVLAGYDNSAGAYTLTVSCPITVVGDVACGETRSGNTSASVSSVGHAAPDNWWRMIAPRDGMYTFDTCGSNYDTWVHVYTRVGESVGPQVSSCDDCGDCDINAVLDTTLDAGDYWVVIDGFASNSGVYSLSVTCPSTGQTNGGDIACMQTVTGNTTGANNTVRACVRACKPACVCSCV